jgi:hypothetical protein
MDAITAILNTIDPVLIAPYRWFDNPLVGWWVGTLILALWAVLLGEASVAVAMRVNRRQIDRNSQETLYYHERSLSAKRSGDDSAYKGINKLANEAFGKSFFLLMATGMASLWPAFFAAAWLHLRFSGLQFPLPAWMGGIEFNFIAPFVLLYILSRMFVGRLRRTVSAKLTIGNDDEP